MQFDRAFPFHVSLNWMQPFRRASLGKKAVSTHQGETTMKKNLYRWLWLFIALILTTSACSASGSKSTSMSAEERFERLATMSPKDCMKQDAYKFISPPEPRVLANGAEFYFDCELGFSGWFFKGPSEDRWSPRSPDEAHIPKGASSVRLPIEWVNPPWDRRHPAYSDAVTLRELVPGTPACIYLSDGPRVDITVNSVFAEVNQTRNGVFGDMVFEFRYSDGVIDRVSLFELGIIPHEPGVWSQDHVRASNC